MERPEFEIMRKMKRDSSSHSMKIYPDGEEEPNEQPVKPQHVSNPSELLYNEEERDSFPAFLPSDIPQQVKELETPLIPRDGEHSRRGSEPTKLDYGRKSIDGETSFKNTTTSRDGQKLSLDQKLYRSRSSFNLVEKVSFSFMNEIMIDGKNRDILISQYPPIEQVDNSLLLAKEIMSRWNSEVDRKGSSAKLGTVLRKIFGFQFMLSGFAYFVETILKVSESYVFGLLLQWFQHYDTESLNTGLLYAGIMSALVLVHSVLNQYKFYSATRIGMQVRVSLVSAIFAKCMRLPVASAYSSAQILSLISNDVQKFEDASGFLHFLWLGPIEACIITYFIYEQIGVAAFAAIVALFILIPIQATFGSTFANIRKKTNIFRDDRIKTLSDMIAGMIVVKLYAWEKPFCEKIDSIRQKEILKIRKASILKAVNEALFFSSSAFISLSAFVVFKLLGGTLDPSRVFVTVTYLQTVRMTMTNLFSKGYQFNSECKVALQRIEALFKLKEVNLVTATDVADEAIAYLNDPKVNIVMKDACFSWKFNQRKTLQSSDMVLKDINIRIHKGELVGVCGPVGGGKSSFLNAILGELECIQGKIGLRSKNIAYVSQNPWLLAGTIRNNILFGKSYKEDWFKEVVKACSLDSDFEHFPDKENTIIGERGLELSGGQRARIALARAVYADAEIYLLDDPLAAVDPKVGKHLFRYCISGVLKKKTVILVTHLIQYIQQCDTVVLLEGGKMTATGNYAKILGVNTSKFASSLRNLATSSSMDNIQAYATMNASKFPKLASIASSMDKELTSGKYASMEKINFADPSDFTDSQEFRNSLAKRRSSVKTGQEDLGIIMKSEESVAQGSMSIKSYWGYFRAGSSILGILILFFTLILGQSSLIATDWWLSSWSALSSTEQNDNYVHLGIYIALGAFTVFIAVTRAISFFLICLSASEVMFKTMTNRVFHAPIYFFQSNPQGRIMNRFTKDISLTDENLPQTFFDLVQRSFMIIGTLVIAAIVVPYVLIVIPFLMVIFMYFRKSYIGSARQMKRMDAITRSPIFSFFTTSIDGKAVIRAYRMRERFENEVCRLQNDNTRVYFSYSCAGRWLGIRLDMLAAVFFTGIVFFCVCLNSSLGFSPSAMGLLISYILQLIGLLQWTVRQSGEVENLMVSTERILEYMELPQEKVQKDKEVPEHWPTAGHIVLNDLSMRYSNSAGLVLKNLNYDIPGGKKVGIVGRTGAGKSSFINALFRLNEPLIPGSIMIDNVSTSDMNLQTLRSRIAIIPQEPFCFKGSVRFNIDPLGKYSDKELWDTLGMVELREVVKDLKGQLDHEISENGGNLSVGERQLICLARAILKKSKLIVMDEATSSIDVTTDQIIHEIVSEGEGGAFANSTVLTIAHRLQTIIDYDIILFLDQGELVEAGSPYELISKDVRDPDARFARLVNELDVETRQSLIEKVMFKMSRH